MMYLLVPALVGVAAAEENFMGRQMTAWASATTFVDADDTVAGNNDFANKDMVYYSKGGVAADKVKHPLVDGTLYCVSDRAAATFKLKAVEGTAKTYGCAAGDGAAVDFTTPASGAGGHGNTGAATNKFYKVTLKDGGAPAAGVTYTADAATKFHWATALTGFANGSHIAYAGSHDAKTHAVPVKWTAGTAATWYTAANVNAAGTEFTLMTTAATPAAVKTSAGTSGGDNDVSASHRHYWLVRNSADAQWPPVAAAGGNAARSASIFASVLAFAAVAFA